MDGDENHNPRRKIYHISLRNMHAFKLPVTEFTARQEHYPGMAARLRLQHGEFQ